MLLSVPDMERSRAIFDMLSVTLVPCSSHVCGVKCEEKPGKHRVASGRSADREAHIMAVPTSMTLQLSEPIV
jgi:hypothetical protein